MVEDALLKAIEQDAREQTERMLKEAGEAAAEMMAAAQEDAGQERRHRTAALAEALDRKAASAVNSARMKVAGQRLSVRHEMAEEVFRRVTERVEGLPPEQYARLLGRLYEELKKDWFGAKEPSAHAVLINPKDAGLVSFSGVEFRPDEGVSLGVVFVSDDGRLRYENTVSSRIKKTRDTLVSMIDGILLGRG
ncbi:MAG: V-type ATP synthase subunit E family protein [Thermodesulfobacteriota bacterium]